MAPAPQAGVAGLAEAPPHPAQPVRQTFDANGHLVAERFSGCAH